MKKEVVAGMKQVFVLMAIAVLVTATSAYGEQKPDQDVLTAQANAPKAESTAGSPKAQPSESKPQQPEGWISNGQSLDKWWKKRSVSFDPMPLPLLYHFEGDYSLTESTGNNESTNHKIKSRLWLRKNIVTSMTNYSLKDSLVTVTKGLQSITSATRKQSLDESIFVEAWKNIDLTGGVTWLRDNKRNIRDRFAYFAGLYFTFLETEAFNLQSGIYYGYMDTYYMNDPDMLKPFKAPPTPNSHSQIVYGIQTFTWRLNKIITFNESAFYRYHAISSQIYHWNLSFDIDVKITDNISVYGGYSLDKDSNPGDQALGIKEKDTEMDCGIRIKF